MTRNRWARLFLLAGVTGLFLAGCAPRERSPEGEDDGAAQADTRVEASYEGIPPEGEPAVGGELRRNLTSEPELINPALSSGLSASYVQKEVFDPLVDYNRDMEIVGVLVEDWDLSEDKRTYTFRLRPGLTWHDGEPLTAEDVEFTYRMIMDPANRALAQMSEFERVESFELVDERTFRVRYKQVYSPALSNWTLQPIPKHVFQDYYEENGEIRTSPRNREDVVGSGPFRLVDWQPQTALILEAYEGYWNGRPWLDRQVIKLIKSISGQFNAAKAGELDVASMSAEIFVRQVDERFRDRFNILMYYMWAYSYIGWNQDGSNPYFGDARVRRAMTLLTDRQAIVDKMQHGYGMIATGPVHPNHWAYPSDVEPLPHDPEAAKRLLEEAGWTDTDGDGWRDKEGRRFSFEILVGATSETFLRIAEFLQQEYRAAGIDMQIRTSEWAAFLERVRGHDFQACMLSWISTPDPHAIRNIWHSDMYDDGRNYIGFSDPEVDRLFQEGMTTFGREDRAPIYAEIHRIIHRAQPYTFLTSQPSTVALHNRFRNVQPSPRGIYLYYPGPRSWYIPEALQGTAAR